RLRCAQRRDSVANACALTTPRTRARCQGDAPRRAVGAFPAADCGVHSVAIRWPTLARCPPYGPAPGAKTMHLVGRSAPFRPPIAARTTPRPALLLRQLPIELRQAERQLLRVVDQGVAVHPEHIRKVIPRLAIDGDAEGHQPH